MCAGAQPNGSSGRLAAVAGFSNWLPGRGQLGLSLHKVDNGVSGEHRQGVSERPVLLMHLALSTAFPSPASCHLCRVVPKVKQDPEVMSETKGAYACTK